MKTYFTWDWPHSCPNCRDLCLLVSLLLLARNTAKSSSKLEVKFGSSSLVSSITFSVKTFTAETWPTPAAMLNSTHHAIDTETLYLEKYTIAIIIAVIGVRWQTHCVINEYHQSALWGWSICCTNTAIHFCCWQLKTRI